MTSIRSRRNVRGKIFFLAAVLPWSNGGAVAQTAPGTAIINRAEVRYAIGDVVRQGGSNAATIVVAERLDVAIAGGGTPTTITPQQTTVPATITNTGSGGEAFVVDARPSSGIRLDLVAADVDADGRYDAAVDRPLAGATPVLAPGESIRLVALVTPVAAPVDGTLTIATRAATGSGDVGRTLPGLGDDGGDAVIGRTGAAASAALPLVAARDGPRLVKSQSVRAPDGSSAAVSGAIVTYTLVASLAGERATDARIEDPVPAGTAYVVGSLTLDGAPLSDAADGDAGACDGRAVAVALGPTPAAARTVTFQVRLP